MGVNSNKKMFNNQNIKTHAEMSALKKLEKNINDKKIKNKKFNLVVIRITCGKLGESAPCFHCTKKLATSNICIDKLFYSTSDGTIKCVKFNDWIQNLDNIKKSSGWRFLAKNS